MRKTKKSILYSVITISVLSIVSKIIGLIREGVIAAYFGTTSETDMFFLIQGILSSVVIFIASSVGISYLPLFIKNMENTDKNYAFKNFSNLINQYLIFSIIITIIVFLFAPYLINKIGSIYSNEHINDIIFYIRIFSLSIFFSGAVYLFNSVLNGMKIFGIGQSVIMIYSIVAIIFSILFHEHLGVKSLAYAWLFSSITQVIILIFIIFRNGRSYSFTLNIRDSTIIKVRKSILPIFLGSETYILTLTIDKLIGASLGTEGVVSALNYSAMMYGLINTIFTTAIITVYYTEFSNKYYSEGSASVVKILKNAMIVLLIILLPISVFLSLNASNFISIAFERGAFNKESVELAMKPFSVYILIAPIYAIRLLFTRAFYVIGNKNTPMINGIIIIAINTILAIILSKTAGIVGIVVSSFITTLLSCIILIFLFNKKVKLYLIDIKKSLIQIFLSIMLSGLLFYSILSKINFENTIIEFFVHFIAFFTTYLTVLLILRNRELRQLINIINLRFKNL